MKRLALLVAAAASLAGTGCGSGNNCGTHDVDVTWNSGFDGPDAAAGRQCAAAGVSYVDVYMDGGQVVGPLANGHFPCGDYGVTVSGVPSGSRRVIVEGIGPDGSSILYRDDRTVPVGGCGITTIATAPAAGFVTFQYQFYDGATPLPPAGQVCAPGSYLWLSVVDQTANQVAVLSDVGSAPTAYSCGGPFTLSLPLGSFLLQWMEERGPATSYVLESADCTDRSFIIEAAATTPVPVYLNVTAPSVCAR